MDDNKVEYRRSKTVQNNDILNITCLLKSNQDDDLYVIFQNSVRRVLTIVRDIIVKNYCRIIRDATAIDYMECFHLNLSQCEHAKLYSDSELPEILEGLDSECRVPFSMYIAGYRCDEIAETMNMSVKEVERLICRGNRKLQ